VILKEGRLRSERSDYAENKERGQRLKYLQE
jgi:hypothetical protein